MGSIHTLDITKRSSRWIILGVLVFVCFGMAVLILARTLTPLTPDSTLAPEWQYGVGLVIFLAVGGGLTLWLGVRAALTELTEDGLVVPGWSGQTRVPWAQVARVYGKDLTLVIFDREGRRFTLPWTVYRNPEDVREFIRQHVPASAKWDAGPRDSTQ